MGVNETTCFGLSVRNQVAKFYDTKYCLCVAEFEFSASDQKLYMRYRMRVSRYDGGRALVCGIVGGGYLLWVLSSLVFGEGLVGEIGLNASNLCGDGDSLDRCLYIISSVTLVSDTSCSTGTCVY